MSYEQKYIKYKQKYLELKNMINELENKNQSGGGEHEDIVLSDTPVNNQHGGYAMASGASGAPVSNMSGVPNASSCAGSVNPQPNVTQAVMPQNTNAVPPPATAPLPSGTAPVATNSKNLTNSQSEEVTTTELKSEVDQIFNQLGGDEHYDPFETRFDDNDSVSSSDVEDSSDESDSVSDIMAVYSPIASDSLPPGTDGAGNRTGLGAGDSAPFN